MRQGRPSQLLQRDSPWQKAAASDVEKRQRRGSPLRHPQWTGRRVAHRNGGMPYSYNMALNLQTLHATAISTESDSILYMHSTARRLSSSRFSQQATWRVLWPGQKGPHVHTRVQRPTNPPRSHFAKREGLTVRVQATQQPTRGGDWLIIEGWPSDPGLVGASNRLHLGYTVHKHGRSVVRDKYSVENSRHLRAGEKL